MRKFILSFLLFIPFAVVVYLVLLFVFDNRHLPKRLRSNLTYSLGAYGHTYSRLKEVKNMKDVDILFLGSSHSYRGFDTRFFKDHGLTTFNLGSISQTPIQTNVLLKRYLQKLHPNTIIYEVYPATFVLDGVESALDIVANDKNDVYSLEMALDINNAKVYNSLVYAYVRSLLNLDVSYVENKQKDEDTYVSGGFVEKKLEHFYYITYKPTKWEFSKEQFRIFGNILDSIKKETHSKVILVYAPITPNLYNSYTNNDAFDSIMNGYGTYYNFNKLLRLDDSLNFYDSHHLNQKGVEIFDNKIMEILKVKQNQSSLTSN